MGADTGRISALGQRVEVRLVEAVPVTGGLMLELLSVEGEGVAPGPRPTRGKPARRAEGKTRDRSGGRRKVVRRRR